MSILQYKITNDGKLEIDAGTLNRNGSETFNRDMLYAFCSDFDISISFGNHVPDYIDAESPEVFGGTTYFYKDKKEAFIVLATTNYPKMRAKDGSYYFASSYETFCHELAGHIVPEIKNENGNAVSIENEICQQLGWIEREEEPDHASF